MTSDITVREAIGIFSDRKHLEDAIKDLRSAGFAHDQLGLLASEKAVQASLGDIYARTNFHYGTAKEPVMAFVKNEAEGDNFWSLDGGLFFAGSTAAVGAVVVSAAVFGGPVLVGLAALFGVGTVGAVASNLISKSDAEYLAEQVDQGHFLLFIRVTSSVQERTALQILSRHSGFDAKIHEVSAAS